MMEQYHRDGAVGDGGGLPPFPPFDADDGADDPVDQARRTAIDHDAVVHREVQAVLDPVTTGDRYTDRDSGRDSGRASGGDDGADRDAEPVEPVVDFDIDADVQASPGQELDIPPVTLRIGGKIYTAHCPAEGPLYHLQDDAATDYDRGENFRLACFGRSQYDELVAREKAGEIGPREIAGTVERLSHVFGRAVEQYADEAGVSDQSARDDTVPVRPSGRSQGMPRTDRR